MSEFVHLHLHTDYSLLDGACDIDKHLFHKRNTVTSDCDDTGKANPVREMSPRCQAPILANPFFRTKLA